MYEKEVFVSMNRNIYKLLVWNSYEKNIFLKLTDYFTHFLVSKKFIGEDEDIYNLQTLIFVYRLHFYCNEVGDHHCLILLMVSIIISLLPYHYYAKLQKKEMAKKSSLHSIYFSSIDHVKKLKLIIYEVLWN